MSAVAIDRPLVLVLDPPEHAVDIVQRWLMDAGFRVQACSTELMSLTVARMHTRPCVIFSHSGGGALYALRHACYRARVSIVSRIASTSS